MFSEEILEQIFSRKDVQRVSLEEQSIMINAVESVLEENNLLLEEKPIEYEY